MDELFVMCFSSISIKFLKKPFYTFLLIQSDVANEVLNASKLAKLNP